MRIDEILKYKFPGIDLLNQVILQDDGAGPYIKKWDDSLGPQPTAEDLAAYEIEVQPLKDLNDVQEARAAEYPSIADQLDLIYHNGIDGWKAVIKAVKDKYPKPGE